MTLRDQLRIPWRWRWVTVASVLIGLVVGWITAPGTDVAVTTFEATHTLLLRARGADESLSLKEILATRGAVPDRVAARLNVDRQLVRSRVSARSRQAGVLLITARSTDRAQAEALANVTAEELIVEVGGENSSLQSIEPALASPVKDEDIKGPNSRPARALLLGGFGLVLGIGAAFAVERFDNRIRSKATAEGALGARVLSEVPPIPRSDRLRMVSMAQPSPFIEAYRALRTSLEGWRAPTDGDRHRVIVVTSPTGGEGVTTTVAHLAAVLGEIGRSVIVISADLRRPQLHLFFDKAREPGLTDVRRGAPDTRRLEDLNLVTTVRGVRFVASGAPVRNPAPLLDHVDDHLRDARSLGDVVLIDAPPLLTISDGADLARHADGVLLVVRAGRTPVSAARRSVELLERLAIPLLGAVLIGSERA